MEKTISPVQNGDDIVDRYMLEYRAALDRVPVKIADEFCREARLHIESLVAEAVADGKPASDAAVEAIVQFGDAKAMGEKMRQEWRRKRAFYLSRDESLCLAVAAILFLIPAAISIYSLSAAEHAATAINRPLSAFAPVPVIPFVSVVMGLVFPRTALRNVSIMVLAVLVVDAWILLALGRHLQSGYESRFAEYAGYEFGLDLLFVWICSALRLRHLEKLANISFSHPARSASV
jgi:hypothetical protein